MRQYYKPLLISIIMTLMITSGLLLLGTLDVTQADTLDCEERFKRECFPRKEGTKPYLICPNPRQPCPLDTAEYRRIDK